MSTTATHADKPTQNSFWKNFRLQLIILLVIIGIQYGNTLNNGFVCDDKMVIEMNDFTQAGVKGLPDIWTRQSLAGFFKDDKRRVGDYWRPIPLSIFAIEHQIFPKKPNFGHFLNLVIYGVLVWLLLGLFHYHLFPDKPLLAFLAALLFCLHPIHTEVVGNIKGRDEMITLIFLLLTLHSIFKYVKQSDSKETAKNLGLASVYYLGALLSKENALAFLGVIPVTLFFFTNLPIKRIVYLLGMLAGVAVVYLSYRYAVVGMGITQQGQDAITWSDVVYNRFAYTNIADKYATVVYILGFYLSLLFFPHPLSWDYSYQQIPFYSWGDFLVWLALAVNIGLIIWGIIGVFKKSVYAYAIAFYFLTLFLVSNLVVDIGGFVGERFLFQPSLGFSILIAALLYDFIEKGKWADYTKRSQVVWGIVGVVGLLFTGKTIARNFDWKSDEILFRADVVHAPNSVKTNYALGTHLIQLAQQAPDAAAQQKLLDEAEVFVQKAYEIYPKNPQPLGDLGVISFFRFNLSKDEKHLQASEKYWAQVRAIDPRNFLNQERMTLLSQVYYDKAAVAATADLAFQYIEKSLNYNPNNHQAINARGTIYAQANDTANARLYFEKAVSLDPKNANYLSDLALFWAINGQVGKAIPLWQKALEIDPNNPRARDGLSKVKVKN